MTLVDLVALTVGVGLCFAPRVYLVRECIFYVPPLWERVIYQSLRFSEGMTIAIAVVALGRGSSYCRMPRPAEWLVIVSSMSVLMDRRPEFNFPVWGSQLFVSPSWSGDRLEFMHWSWVVADLACVAILVTFLVVQLGQRVLAHWLKTLLLAWMALLALNGPLWVFENLGGDLISPREGFNTGALSMLHWRASRLFGLFPTGVFFGVPAVAALLDRIAGKRWSWVEWVGVIASTMVACLPMMIYRSEYDRSSTYWLAERTLTPTWLLVVTITSWLIVAKLGPPWQRWIEGQTDQDRSSS
jgi:hypothetical protein